MSSHANDASAPPSNPNMVLPPQSSRIHDKLKSMSLMERKREEQRQVDRVLASKDDQTPQVETEDILPKKLLQLTQYTILFGFGLITLCGFAALLFYILDQAAAVFDADLDQYLIYVGIIVVVLTEIGCLIGCFVSFKFGTVSSNIDLLKDQTHKIADNVADFREIREMLKSQVNELKSTLRQINTEKNELYKTVNKFDKLSESLQDKDGKSKHTAFAEECSTMVDDLYGQFEKIKLANDKANLLKIFYDKQGDDGEDGLNPTEYEYLMFDLDEDIRERFPTFEEFDINGDGVIDIFEFEQKLDELYEKIFEEQNDSVSRRIGSHYGRGGGGAADELKQRRKARRTSAMEREKQKRPPLSIFKFFK
eukprot:CAMPEP_0202686748 /NCGR_PEP_ID=MMETSP1385-20130828/2517_1 /ASSEMBLY_ACC=CAM_ASM_000861 /TAXON_ID=933848 /ORGANISM="Elphidium margaritaceum" /LENGTH=365 /DNA_ID=CAMNT_0049341395 /DNA_START=21 /DNA_END=1118 /DNA_ORIENTATION=+